jgi:uncharacterized protein DUF6111
MLRVFATIVLPLVLPTALYLCWITFVQRTDVIRWNGLPFAWLAAAGAVLLGFVLFVVTVGFGTSQPGTYVPPRWENGRIVPGHVEPRRDP